MSFKNVICKTKNTASSVKRYVLVSLVLSMLVVMPAANAAVPSWASTIVTDLTTDAGTFMTSLSAIFVTFVVGFLWFKILGKGVQKVT